MDAALRAWRSSGYTTQHERFQCIASLANESNHEPALLGARHALVADTSVDYPFVRLLEVKSLKALRQYEEQAVVLGTRGLLLDLSTLSRDLRDTFLRESRGWERFVRHDPNDTLFFFATPIAIIIDRTYARHVGFAQLARSENTARSAAMIQPAQLYTPWVELAQQLILASVSSQRSLVIGDIFRSVLDTTSDGVFHFLRLVIDGGTLHADLCLLALRLTAAALGRSVDVPADSRLYAACSAPDQDFESVPDEDRAVTTPDATRRLRTMQWPQPVTARAVADVVLRDLDLRDHEGAWQVAAELRFVLEPDDTLFKRIRPSRGVRDVVLARSLGVYPFRAHTYFRFDHPLLSALKTILPPGVRDPVPEQERLRRVIPLWRFIVERLQGLPPDEATPVEEERELAFGGEGASLRLQWIRLAPSVLERYRTLERDWIDTKARALHVARYRHPLLGRQPDAVDEITLDLLSLRAVVDAAARTFRFAALLSPKVGNLFVELAALPDATHESLGTKLARATLLANALQKLTLVPGDTPLYLI
jgi:hypothetical protein